MEHDVTPTDQPSVCPKVPDPLRATVDEQSSSLVVARRYRPERFEDVVGQTRVVENLRQAIRSGRIAHAYLFCGTRGWARRRWPGSSPSA